MKKCRFIVSANFAVPMRGRRIGFVMLAVRDQFSRVSQPQEQRGY